MPLLNKLLDPLKLLSRTGRLSGLFLIIATIISLILINSIYQQTYLNFWHLPLNFINDGLMVIFFLLVGLEIKYELLAGELVGFKKAILPLFAALGGMIFPAIIFTVFNTHSQNLSGWAIPCATDIAFSLGALSLLGKKVPIQLKIFLAALAIIDDLGAIVIIGLFYTHQLHLIYLLAAGIIFLGLLALNYFKAQKLIYYFSGGLILWWLILASGIHATIAGVLLAITIPLPLVKKLADQLTKPVNYLILPIFALANTAIALPLSTLKLIFSPVSYGIIAGLCLGKPLGIVLFSYLAVKSGLAKLPQHVTWPLVLGLGFTAGIGFTMSIFISTLAYQNPVQLNTAKLAILAASVISTILGLLYLNWKISHKGDRSPS